MEIGELKSKILALLKGDLVKRAKYSGAYKNAGYIVGEERNGQGDERDG